MQRSSVARASPAQIRHRNRRRNQPHCQAVARDFRDRQRNAVDRNAPLVDHVSPASGRPTHPQKIVIAALLEDLDHPQPVDVARDKVAADLSVEAQAPFQINRSLGRERGKISQTARLLQYIKIKMSRLLITAKKQKTMARAAL